jgi:hypothetical protein
MSGGGIKLTVWSNNAILGSSNHGLVKVNTFHKLKVSYIIRYVIIKHALVKELLILQVQNDDLKP